MNLACENDKESCIKEGERKTVAYKLERQKKRYETTAKETWRNKEKRRTKKKSESKAQNICKQDQLKKRAKCSSCVRFWFSVFLLLLLDIKTR